MPRLAFGILLAGFLAFLALGVPSEGDLLFAELRQALVPERFRPEAAYALLGRASREFPELQPRIDAFVGQEHARVAEWLQGLSGPLDPSLAARVGLIREWLNFLSLPTDPAKRLLPGR